jgi:ABC-type glutathione transport system ATPase component
MSLGRLEVAIKQKSYSAATGGNLQVIRGLTLDLRHGEVGALVGPSGAARPLCCASSPGSTGTSKAP